IVRALINAGLKHDPKHPRFRFYKLSNENRGRFDGQQIELNAIRDEAVKRGDSATIKLVAGVLDSFRHERGQHELPDWDEPEEPPSGEDIARMIPPEIIADMLKKVSAMNDAEFEDFRRQTLEMMPAEFFEVLFGEMNRQRKGRGAARR
ncbi:MAG: hypothetical protein JWL90_642, partial [Chthoniobacteraceae bacterium]|nr:hypothetical protein [Chthoniobacteraceae bacterium]